MVMFEDFEPRRDATVRWLSGQPGDALLFLSADRKTLLAPWDMIMAKACATADQIVPYNDFDRSAVKATRAAAERLGVPAGSKIEIPPSIPYPAFLDYVAELSEFDVLCRDKCAAARALEIRAVKDEAEIAIYREATAITSEIIDLLESKARAGKLKTEADAAMLIEVEARKRGCDGTSFDTLAAGPTRSFGIHAVPGWTYAPFAEQGLSILDFGVRYRGYCTDVTMTFARDPSAQQQKMVELVEAAAKAAEAEIRPGNNSVALAQLVDDLFAKSKKTMEHGLGHGVGLDVHEAPFLRSRGKEPVEFVPGMIFAVEPALYDPVHGGTRLENDFLVTEGGSEMLTRSRVVRL
jgi:Xaa-Pro dipeptidase